MSIEPHSEPLPSRRTFLRGAARALLVLPAGYLLGCAKSADCDDTSGLTPAELEARELQNYLAPSPDPERYCAACKLYNPPADDRSCGGCTMLKGPVRPNGSCKLFETKGPG